MDINAIKRSVETYLKTHYSCDLQSSTLHIISLPGIDRMTWALYHVGDSFSINYNIKFCIHFAGLDKIELFVGQGDVDCPMEKVFVINKYNYLSNLNRDLQIHERKVNVYKMFDSDYKDLWNIIAASILAENIGASMTIASDKITISSNNNVVSNAAYLNNGWHPLISVPIVKNIYYNFEKSITTVLWADGTKTVVKCVDEDEFDPEVGFAMALMKKIYPNRSEIKRTVDEEYRKALAKLSREQVK